MYNPSSVAEPLVDIETTTSDVYEHKPKEAVRVIEPAPSVIEVALLANVTTGAPSSSSIASATL